MKDALSSTLRIIREIFDEKNFVTCASKKIILVDVLSCVNDLKFDKCLSLCDKFCLQMLLSCND